MAGQERQLRADAKRNRAKVIDAARRVIARDGTGASMRQVASTAGVGLATVYRQFPTKENMLEAIAAEQINALADRAEALATATDPGAAFFTFFDEAIAGASHQSESIMEALAVTDPQGGMAEKDARLVAATEALLTRAQADGAVRADLSIPDLAVLLSAGCFAAYRADDDDQLARILAVFRQGLAARETL